MGRELNLGPELREYIRVHHIDAGEIISDRSIGESSQEEPEISPVNSGIQWIHIPVNSIVLVALCFSMLNSEFDLDPRITSLKVRPALAHVDKPRHSLHMEASCTEGTSASFPRTQKQPSEPSNTGNEPGNFASAGESSRAPSKKGKQPISHATRDTASGPNVERPSWLPALTLYLPYMSWELYSNYRALREQYKNARHENLYQLLKDTSSTRTRATATSQTPTMPAQLPSKKSPPNTAGTSQTTSRPTPRVFARPRPNYENSLDIHPRRTLDQFYYPSLVDTSGRDADQTISKWTGHNLGVDGRDAAADDSSLLMIDQLWCWVIDDRTIISSFPYKKHPSISPNYRDLYDNVRQRVHNCESAWDLQGLLFREAVSYLLEQENKNVVDLIETYKWASGTKAARQTSCFQEFHKKHTSNLLDATAFDDSKEFKLALEVADILDELKMIRHLVQTQRDVLKSFTESLTRLHPSGTAMPNDMSQVYISDINLYDRGQMYINVQNQASVHHGSENAKLLAQGISGRAADHVVAADETLVSLLVDLDRIKDEAASTHQLINDLLDLKSNAASLAEARSATKQGQAVMLFTVVTIIFLPLSFFTSYFGQNVSELTGDDQNPSSWDLWRVGTPISVVVIALALLIALLIMKPHWRRYLVSKIPRKVLHRDRALNLEAGQGPDYDGGDYDPRKRE